jgi:hypothetical protein
VAAKGLLGLRCWATLPGEIFLAGPNSKTSEGISVYLRLSSTQHWAGSVVEGRLLAVGGTYGTDFRC